MDAESVSSASSQRTDAVTPLPLKRFLEQTDEGRRHTVPRKMVRRHPADSHSSASSHRTSVTSTVSHMSRISALSADNQRRRHRGQSVGSLSNASTRINEALDMNSEIPWQVGSYCRDLAADLSSLFPNQRLYIDAKRQIGSIIYNSRMEMLKRENGEQTRSDNNEEMEVSSNVDSPQSGTLEEPSTASQNVFNPRFYIPQTSNSTQSFFPVPPTPSPGNVVSEPPTPSPGNLAASVTSSSTPLDIPVSRSSSPGTFTASETMPLGFSLSQEPTPETFIASESFSQDSFSGSQTQNSTLEPVADSTSSSAAAACPSSPQYPPPSPSPPLYSPDLVYQPNYSPSVPSLALGSPMPLYSPASPSFSTALNIDHESEDEDGLPNMPREEKLLFTCSRCNGFHETCHFCVQCKETLCSNCERTIGHPHPLMKKGLGLERGFFQATSERQLNKNKAVIKFLLRFMKSVEHTTRCQLGDCNQLGCEYMKPLLVHFKRCHTRSCDKCKRLRALCCNNKFQMSKSCPGPFCKDKQVVAGITNRPAINHNSVLAACESGLLICNVCKGKGSRLSYVCGSAHVVCHRCYLTDRQSNTCVLCIQGKIFQCIHAPGVSVIIRKC